MKSYEVYMKTDCEFCRKAVNLLSLKGIPFVAIVCDKDPAYLEDMKANLNWPTVPIILRQDEAQKVMVGGFAELEKEFTDG